MSRERVAEWESNRATQHQVLALAGWDGWILIFVLAGGGWLPDRGK